MSVKKRLLEYLEYKQITQYEFCKKAKLANGFFKSGDHISSKSLERITDIYDDLNLVWLLQGVGEKLLPQKQNPKKYVISETDIFYQMAREDNDDLKEVHKRFMEAIQNSEPEKFFYYLEDYFIVKNKYINSLEEQIKIQKQLLDKVMNEKKDEKK